MLKNISNNVKCVKVQYAKILLSSASLFALSIWIVMNLWTCKWGKFNSPILYKVPLFISQMSHSSDQTPVANKKVKVNTTSASPNGSVQSYYIQAIFALKVKSRHEKNNSTGANWESLMWVFHLIIPKSVSRPTAKWPLPKRKHFCISF